MGGPHEHSFYIINFGGQLPSLNSSIIMYYDIGNPPVMHVTP